MKTSIKNMIFSTFSIGLIGFSTGKYLNSNLFEKNIKAILKNVVKVNADFDSIEFKNNKILINNLKLYTLDGEKVADVSKSFISINLLTPTKIDEITFEDGKVFIEKKGDYLNLANIKKKSKRYSRSSNLNNVYLKNIDLKINNKEIKNVNGRIKMGYQKPFELVAKANNNEKINLEIKTKKNIKQNPLDIFSVKKHSDSKKTAFDINADVENFEVNDFISEMFLSNKGVDIKKAKLDGKVSIKKDFDKNIDSKGNLVINNALIKYKEYNDDIFFKKTNVNFDNNKVKFDTNTKLDNALVNIKGKLDLKEKDIHINTEVKDLSSKELKKFKQLNKFDIKSDKIDVNVNLIFNTKDKFSIKDVNGKVSTNNIKVKDNCFNNVNFDLSTNSDTLNVKSSEIKFNNKDLKLTLENETKLNLNNFDINSKTMVKNHNDIVDIKEFDVILNKKKDDIKFNINSDKLNAEFKLKDKMLLGNLNTKDKLNVKYKNNKIKAALNGKNIKYDLNKKELVDANLDLLLNLRHKNECNNVKANFKVKENKYNLNALLDTSYGNLNIKGTTSKDLKHSYNLSSNNFDYISYLKYLGILKNEDIKTKDKNINLDIKGYNLNNKLNLDLKSNKKINILYKDVLYNISPDINNVVYNLKNKKLERVDLTTNIKVEDKGDIKLNANLNELGYNINAVVNSGNSKLYLNGITDKNLNHKYNIKAKDFDVLKLAKDMNLISKDNTQKSLKMDINSKIYGKDKNLQGDFYIESEYGAYIAEYEKAKIYGRINDLLNTDIDVKLNFEELWLSYQRLLDVNSEMKITKDKIDIKEFGNDKVYLKGKYDIKDKYLDLNGKINSYNVYTTNNIDANLILTDLAAKIYGHLNSLNGEITTNESPIILNGKEFSNLKFAANLENNILNVTTLNVDDTDIKAMYDINNKYFDIDLKSKGEIIKELIKIDDLKYNSSINLKINGTKDNANVVGNIELEDVKYKDYEISKVLSNVNYVGMDLSNIGKSGILNVNRFDIYDKNDKEILSFNDSFDLENIDLNYEVKDKVIDLEKLEFLNKEKYSGKILLNSIFRYSNNEKFGSLVLKGRDLKINNFKLNDLSIDLQGTDKGINISEVYVNYENNPLLLEGYLTYPNIDYNLRLIANDFNLNFLEITKKVKKSSGLVNFDMYISKNNVEGLIDLDNVNIVTSDNKTNIKNFNSNVDLHNKTIQIHDISGNLNGGDFKIFGKFDIPTISNDFIQSKKILLGPIDIYSKFDNVKMYLKDNEVKFTSEINMKDNTIKGNVLLNETLIKSIPKKNTKKNKLNSYFIDLKDEIIKNILNQYSIDIDLETEKDIKVNIPVFAGIVKDIKSQIEARIKFTMSNSNMDLISDIIVNSGSFELNNNKFILEDTYVKTTGPIDPVIKLKATTNFEGDEISILMDGKLSEKNIKFSSASGKTTDEILGLLAFNRTGGLLNFKKFKASNIMGRALETSLNNLVFNGINNTVTSTLGLNEFKLKANFDSNTNGKIEDIISNTSTTLYIKDRLFNLNNVFWSAELTVPFDLKTETVKKKLRYDLALNYLLKDGISLNAGIKKPINIHDNILNNNIVTFYGGLKYEKQYQDFSQILEDLSTLFKKRQVLNGSNKK